jgi:hypothetical protein
MPESTISLLWLWFKEPDERRVWTCTGQHKFRWPWSRLASVRLVVAAGFPR